MPPFSFSRFFFQSCFHNNSQELWKLHSFRALGSRLVSQRVFIKMSNTKQNSNIKVKKLEFNFFVVLIIFIIFKLITLIYGDKKNTPFYSVQKALSSSGRKQAGNDDHDWNVDFQMFSPRKQQERRRIMIYFFQQIRSKSIQINQKVTEHWNCRVICM